VPQTIKIVIVNNRTFKIVKSRLRFNLVSGTVPDLQGVYKPSRSGLLKLFSASRLEGPMKAVVLLKLKTLCGGSPYPMRSRPVELAPYYSLCACPGCWETCQAALERWRESHEVDVFTITACNEKEAEKQLVLFQLWCDGLRQRGATYSPMGVST